MKQLLLSFASLFLAMSANATNYYTYGYYTYSICNKEISLYKYSDDGKETFLDIPSKIGEYTVTELNNPSESGYTTALIQSECKISDIYIPSSIKRIFSIANNLSTLKSVIFENGDSISLKSNTIIPYYFKNKHFDYILILNDNSDNKFTIQNLIGTEKLNSKIYKKSPITIKYNNKSTEKVSLFLYYNEDTNKTFGDTQFNYLISALKKRGTDLGTISEIDLSGISANYTQTFESNPANELSFGASVITNTSTSSSYTYTNNSAISDKASFTAPSSDVTTTISYSRENTKDWNSVCLPFDIQESDFGEGNYIYTIESATSETINLSRIAEGGTITAGTPCFIYSESDSWNLNLEKTIRAEVTAQTTNLNGIKLIGSFTRKTIGTNKYKLVSDGSSFGPTISETATIAPFRCYIEMTGSNAPSRLNVNIDEGTSITIIPDDAAPQKVKLYDLMGRHRKEGTRGLFIKSTR